LVERGHIYIAQPPLYKVKKGKQEYYVKDDDALQEYLIQLALDETVLHVNPQAPGISGAALESLLSEYRQSFKFIKRLAYRYPEKILEAMIYLPIITPEMRKDATVFENWSQELLARLMSEGSDTHRYEVSVSVNPETQEQIIMVCEFVHGVDTLHNIDNKFFSSADYHKLTALGTKIKGLIEKDGFIRRGEKQVAVSDFKEVYEWLIQEAKRGLVISRYKGLGEMNPEQLWETTMDPSTRRLLQVTIEDAIAADQLFTTLMGDQVEPRRDFIEANALRVENLDV